VVLSNSMLVVTRHPTQSASRILVIRDQLSEIVELVPSVPKLYKLESLLRGMEYGEEQESGEMSSDGTSSASLSFDFRNMEN
jgi:sister chromatid cohesion protein DCC1